MQQSSQNYHEDGGHASLVSDERPTAVQESVTQQLIKLLADMPACKTNEFEAAAVHKGPTQRRARQFLQTGIATGKISWDVRVVEALHPRRVVSANHVSSYVAQHPGDGVFRGTSDQPADRERMAEHLHVS